jgi:outer membrane protein assembly factor BamB
MQALDAVTGETIWTFPPIEDTVLQPPACYPHFYEPGNLVVDDETVYIVSELINFDLMQAGERDSGISLLAIDRWSGELEWGFLVPVMGDSYANSPPIITEEVVSFFDREAHIYTVNRETGLEMWSVGDDIDIISPPVAKGDSFYFIGFDDNYLLHIFMFDSKTGVEQRRIPMEVDEGQIHTGLLNIIEDTAYLLLNISERRDPPKGYLYAFDIVSGQEQWHFNSDQVLSDNTPLAYDDDTIYFSTSTTLHAVDQITGQQKWKFTFQDELNDGPILADGIIYVGDHGGDLYAIPVPVDTPNDN